MNKVSLATKTNKAKSPRLKVTLKLKDNGGRTFTYHSRKTKRIISIIKKEKFLEAVLKVGYGKGFENCGIFDKKEDLLYALKAFTEKPLEVLDK